MIFLGMAGFNSQFIPSYATLSGPLRDLTKKGVNFKWGQPKKRSFDTITRAICDNTRLLPSRGPGAAYFRGLGLPTPPDALVGCRQQTRHFRSRFGFFRKMLFSRISCLFADKLHFFWLVHQCFPLITLFLTLYLLITNNRFVYTIGSVL